MMTLDHDLAKRLQVLEECVRAGVARRRVDDPNPDDLFRGMYIADEHVDELLDGPTVLAEPIVVSMPHPSTMLGLLAQRFELSSIDVAILVVALAPDIDERYERLYGYLHDDITRRRASPGLALELCGCLPVDPAARLAVSTAGRLIDAGLVELDDRERPFLTRSLRVPDRVLDHLLGNDAPDTGLFDVAMPTVHRTGPIADAVARALIGGTMLVHLRERTDTGAVGLAATALRRAGLGEPVCVDVGRAHPDDQFRLADIARREAKLIGGGLVVVGYHDLPMALRRHLARGDVATILIGAQAFDPDAAHLTPLSLDVDAPSSDDQILSWQTALGASDIDRPPAFRLGPRQIERAVAAGRASAAAAGEHLHTDHLIAGARQQNSVGLERLARRIDPSVGWDGIILDDATSSQLHELMDRVAHRSTVLDEWGLRRGGGRGEGIIALFAGASGTGKTLAAEVIAAELGLELYVIDLSTVVDKYIGETEKNLERIFTEAEGVNAVLFFDEADALFGKRSEVSDARDRYANVEVAYLLQRLETFDGLGILATNLKTNLDDAFARRLSMVVDFPDPHAELRERLWQHMTSGLPLDPDVDLEFCGAQFELSGGNIRNIVLAAAFKGAADDGVVRMHDLIHGTRLEYQKLGRMCLEREFGPYYHLVGGSHGAHTRR